MTPQDDAEARTGSADFARLVGESFAFLEADGFVRTVVDERAWVRYESPLAFVSVTYGRGMGELEVSIGRWIYVAGEPREQAFPLALVVALSVPRGEIDFRDFATYDGDNLDLFVTRLAEWTARYGEAALRGDPTTFEALSASNTRWFEEGEAARLRQAADEAWRERDLQRAADGYRRILAELTTVQLRPSELARLRYAERQLGE